MFKAQEAAPNRRRYIGAYIILECYRNVKIPITGVTVTAVSHTPAVAAVSVHPNPHLYRLTRGVNVFVVCDILEPDAYTHPKSYVMFIGDVSSIQTSASSRQTDYVINLVDNRRYLNELPTFYLKLLRTQYETHNTYQENNETVTTIYDNLADASFYGVSGQYIADSFNYKITEPTQIIAFMQSTYMGSIKSYLRKIMAPLKPGEGWEPYYVNINKKKRIREHVKIYDNGIFRSDIRANFTTAAVYGAIQSIKNAHASMHTTYDEAIARLSELGYTFNTCLFPGYTSGDTNEINVPLDATLEQDVVYYIKASPIMGDIVSIIKTGKNEPRPFPLIPGSGYALSGASLSRLGVRSITTAKNYRIYSITRGEYTYHVIVNEFEVTGSNRRDTEEAVNEFLVIPKLYGVIPPPCNWGVIDDGVAFNCAINEPPITALKYNLVEGGTGDSIYSFAYPGNLQIYSKEGAAAAGYGPGDVVTANEQTKLMIADNQTLVSTARQHAHRSTPSLQGGTDLAMERGEPIYSYTDGVVIAAVYDPNAREGDASHNAGWGNLVTVRSEGPSGSFVWFYSHLKDVYVGKNDRITAGTIIGTCGATGAARGSHLHLSIKSPTGKWVNTTYLFGNTGAGNPAIIYDKQGRQTDIVSYPVYAMARSVYIATPGTSGLPVGAPPDTGVTLYAANTHFPDEHVYGLKRVSTSGNQLYELEKISQYLEGESKIDGERVAMTAENKLALLKAKVVQDYHESRVSRNTGTVTFDGLNEYVAIGFPYILYHPDLDMFYYGLVEEVSHRIDNSAGAAYTEISLSAITHARTIQEIERRFAGYTKSKYVGRSGLEQLNEIYGMMLSTRVKEEEYDVFGMDTRDDQIPQGGWIYNPGEQDRTNMLIGLMCPGRNYRPICTIERLQRYMYNNAVTLPILDRPADNVSNSRQWITRAMYNAINDIFTYYSSRLKTEARTHFSPIPEPENATPENEGMPHESQTQEGAEAGVNANGSDDSNALYPDITGWENYDQLVGGSVDYE